MAHDALDRWLDQLGAETSDAPTLREISERFLHTRHTVLSSCLETIIRQRYGKDLQQTEAVCTCGRRLFSPPARCEGDLDAARPIHFAPAVLLLRCLRNQLSERHHQFDVRERTTRLGADLPFGLSADQFAHLTGVSASPHFIHESLNAAGETATLDRVIPDAAEISRRIDEARGDSTRRPVLVVACDGAMAPTRPPGGRRKNAARGVGAKRKACACIC
jgi:hypothetical protein